MQFVRKLSHFLPNFIMMKSLRPILSIPFLVGALLGAASSGLASGLLGSSVFTDVPVGSNYDEAVGELNDAGIMKGIDATHFKPNDTVTRAQLAVIVKHLRDQMNGVIPEETRTSVNSSASRSSRKSVKRSSAKSSVTSSTSSSAPSTQAAVRNPKGTVRFTSNNFVVAESMVNATIAVVRTGGAEGTITVDYATGTDGTAVAGTDFTATKGTLTLENKQTSKTFTIPIVNSVLAQGNKTVTITLSNITNGATLGTPASATLTITDNQSNTDAPSSSTPTVTSTSSAPANPAGTLSLAAGAYMVNEAAGTLTVNVKRDGGSTGAVGVNYATIDGSATAGSQYTGTTGTLSFAAGETSKTFSVSIVNSTSITGSRTFGVTISNPTGGATIAASGNTANVIVFDNESGSFGSGSFKLLKGTANVSKGAGSIAISITRVGGTVGTATVNYVTNNGSASAGTDFTAVSGTATFAPGEQAKNVIVPILKTSAVNAGKTFTFDLNTPSSPTTLVVPFSETITIDN